jgi:hypothetical protein
MRALSILLITIATTHLANAETELDVRTIEYGMWIQGLATGDEQTGLDFRQDVYRLHGHAGDHVHAAVIAPTASGVLLQVGRANKDTYLEVDAAITDTAGTAEGWTTTAAQTNRFAGDFTLPDDGDYDVTITLTRDELTADSAPIRYTLAVDRQHVVSRLSWLADHGENLGWHMQSQFGFDASVVNFSTESRYCVSIRLALGAGLQLSDKLGVDLLANTSIALNPSSPDGGTMNPVGVLSTLVGPRLRHGNKYSGFTGLSAGLTYVAVLSGLPMAADDADAIGVGARLDWAFAVMHSENPNWDSGVMLSLQGEWNGPVSIYSAGLGFSF